MHTLLRNADETWVVKYKETILFVNLSLTSAINMVNTLNGGAAAETWLNEDKVQEAIYKG